MALGRPSRAVVDDGRPVLDLLRALFGRRLDPAGRLLLGQLVMFTGIAAMFPVVPLYVRAHGGSSVDIALFVAGPFIANTVVQVPAGHLVDRIGRKPVLIGSRLLFAALSFALFADVGPLWLLGLFRLGQGASGGAYVPALRAALADLTPVERRGRRYAQLQACEMVGLLVGPAIGGGVALWRLSAIFLCSGIAVLIGIVALIRLPETRETDTDAVRRPAPPRWWRTRSLLVPAAGLFALGATFSMYDVVWPQYLSARGYDSFVIGLTISTYAIPILLLAGTGGRIADRDDRRLLVASAMIIGALCLVSYPPLHSLVAILFVGIVESVAIVVLEPTLFAVISETADPAVRGRAMGVGGLFQFGGSGIGAGVLGSLYGAGEPVPFIGAACLNAAAALLCLTLLPVRVRRTAPAEPVSAATEIEVRI